MRIILIFVAVLFLGSCKIKLVHSEPIHQTIRITYLDNTVDTLNVVSRHDCLHLDTDVFNNSICLEDGDYDIACNVKSYKVLHKIGGNGFYELNWFWSILIYLALGVFLLYVIINQL